MAVVRKVLIGTSAILNRFDNERARGVLDQAAASNGATDPKDDECGHVPAHGLRFPAGIPLRA
jgi:hypothetical protein